MADRSHPRELCDHLRPWLERYADGELHDERCTRVLLVHLDACVLCRARLRELDELIAEVLRSGGFDFDAPSWLPRTAFEPVRDRWDPLDPDRLRDIVDAVEREPTPARRGRAPSRAGAHPLRPSAHPFRPSAHALAAAALVCVTVLAAGLWLERSAVAPGEPGEVAFVERDGHVRPVRLGAGDAVEGERRVFLEGDRTVPTQIGGLRWVLGSDVPERWSAEIGGPATSSPAESGRVWLLGAGTVIDSSPSDPVFEVALEVLVDDGRSPDRGSARVLVLPEVEFASPPYASATYRLRRATSAASGRPFRAVAAQLMRLVDRPPVPHDLVRPIPRYRIVPVRTSWNTAPSDFPLSPSSMFPADWARSALPGDPSGRGTSILVDPARLDVGPRS